MRHQALPAVHPDAQYALWNGTPFRVTPSTAEGKVLLIAPEGQQPDGFDTTHDGAAAKLVAEDDLPSTFTIRTHCRFAEETFALADQHTDGTLELHWIGSDATVAAELGLTPMGEERHFGAVAKPADVEALWQEYHGLGASAPADASEADQRRLLRRIGRILRELRPADGGTTAARFRQVGGYAELEVRGVADDVAHSLAAPPLLGQLFSELRALMYQPNLGTWFQGTMTVTPDDNFTFDYDASSQPRWRRAPDEDGRDAAQAFELELRRFPRDTRHVPPWLGARAGLPLDVTFRHAKVVDMHHPGKRPVVNRAPVPGGELRGVMNYLYRSPVVHVGDAPTPDLFAPQTAPSVPNAFHTDGTWIWSAAVPHYLRMHGVSPEADLLAHIRANSYRPPFVSQRLRDTARAEVLGAPYPPQSAADLDEQDAVTEVERDDSVIPTLRASEVLSLLRKRLDELGVGKEAYRFGEQADDAWCLLRASGGWRVAWCADGKQRDVQEFPTIKAAAAHLLGVLAFHPTRALAAPHDEEHPTDWPIVPLRGEPPLTLLRGKRIVTLPAGTRLVRFGDDAGNLTHEASATFRETSLLPDREGHRTEYRLRRPLRVLTGVTLPWGGMPGGALAYLLPRPIGQHVSTGALEALE
ncbi:TNT domain-containing protein [Haloechinothrix halophila]|uniref:TNT domain-containing protein n=1 Tax=Haloechinothrix halophila TaxID=1069073 RepID=UPI000551519A|nr:TNT domain-containing protein [Haloechinothrix halophila]